MKTSLKKRFLKEIGAVSLFLLAVLYTAFFGVLKAQEITGTVNENMEIPLDFPEITVNVNTNPSPGLIFLSNFPLEPGVNYSPYLMILKADGTPYFYRKMSAGLNLDFKLQPNGIYTYFDYDKKKFYALDTADFRVIDSFACSSNYVGDEHELRILPNGNYLLFANEIREMNLTQIVPGGKPNAKVINFVIQEITPGGEVVFEWNTIDHFQITDATDNIDLTGFVVDWVHCNAIELDFDGNILLSSRYLDEITKIDRSTGEIIWRMGGKMCKNNQFRFISDSTADFFGFSHQHAVRRLPNGNITMLDNGNLKNPQFTRAVEYKLDEENKTATLVWQFRHNPDIYTNSMGYVQRLENGNTVIGWGENENAVAVSEVTPGGEVVYEMSLPQKQYSYRAYKFNVLHTGIVNPEANRQSELHVFPNPARDILNIDYTVEHAGNVSVELYPVNGKNPVVVLNDFKTPGNYTVKVNCHNIKYKGAQVVVLKTDKRTITKRVVVF